MSSVVWISDARARSSVAEPIKVTFMERPRGIKVWGSGPSHMSENGVQSVTIGIEDGKFLLIRPSIDTEYRVKSVNDRILIPSIAVYRWAEENNMLGRTIEGEWNGRRGMYVFSLRS